MVVNIIRNFAKNKTRFKNFFSLIGLYLIGDELFPGFQCNIILLLNKFYITFFRLLFVNIASYNT